MNKKNVILDTDPVEEKYSTEEAFLHSSEYSDATYKPTNNRLSNKDSKKTFYRFVKRLFDFVLSFIAIVLAAVPMLVIAVIIWMDDHGPVLYIHQRIGKNGKKFPLLKFRTMHVNAEEMIREFSSEQKKEWEENFKLEKDPRVTRVGRFLRRSSLDELPQLFNILKGELSIVGPRPIVDAELEQYGDKKEKFLSVKPGLTGYWQAYARSTCTYKQRMEMELHYVDNANFWWDIKIMFATVGAVLRGRGAK